MDVFAIVSGWASIFGLAASAWAVYEVRKLRQRYVLHVRVPQYVDRLESHSANLTLLVAKVESDSNAADSEVARLRATLKSLAGQMGTGNRQEVSAVQSRVAQTLPVQHTQDVQDIRAAIDGLRQHLTLLVEDDPWM